MRIRTRAVLIALTRIGQALVGMVLSIVLARTLDKTAFAAYQQVFLVGGFLAGLLAPHLSSSLYYFLVRDRPHGCRRHFIDNAAALVVVTGLASLAMWLFADPIAEGMNHPEIASDLRLFAPYPLLFGLMGQIQPALIAVDQGWVATRQLGIGFALRLVAVLSVVALGGGVAAVLLAQVGATALTCAIAAPVVWRALTGEAERPRLGRMREQLTYTLPLAGAAIIGTVNVQLDRFLVSFFCAPEVFAVYSVGSIELPLIGFVTAALGTAILPDLVALNQKGDLKGVRRLWEASVEKSAIVLIPATCFLLPFATDLMVTLYGASYADAAWPFAIYLLRLPLRVVSYGMLWRALNRNENTIGAIVLALLVNLGVGAGLLMAFGDHPLAFVAPAIGSVAATVAASAWQQRIVTRVFGQPMLPLAFCGRVFAASFVALVPALPLLAFELPAAVRLALAAAAFGVAFALVGTARGLVTRDEWELAVRLVPGAGLRARIIRLAATVGRWPRV